MKIWKLFAESIEENSVHEDFKDALAKAASQIWAELDCSTTSGGVVCYICPKGSSNQLYKTGNKLGQFQEHCVGVKHWNKVKALREQKKPSGFRFQ